MSRAWCGGLAVFFSIAGCGGTGPARGLQWQAPTALSPPAGSGAAPAFAVSQTGRVTAAWTGARGGGSDGRLMVRPDVGQPADVELRDPLGWLTIYGETPPKLAYGPDGMLYAAYLLTKAEPGHEWPTNTLRLATSVDGGRHWAAAVTVQADTANGGSTDDHALLAAPDGTIYLSWLALRHDTSHVYVAWSRDHGQSWSRPTAIELGAACPCCRTALAVGPDGRLFASWRRIFGYGDTTQVRDIVVASTADRGATWSAPVKVHADDWHVDYCPDAGPTIKVGSDGVVHVAWWTGAPGAAGVRYTQSRDGGRSFERPVALGVARVSRAAHAQLVVDDRQRVIVAWDDGTRQVPAIVVKVSMDGGRKFGPGDALSAAGQSAGYPVVAVARDSVFVAWQERTPAAAAADSTRMERAMAGMKTGPALAAPDSFINRVGSWSVLMRRAALP
ncbi:MAG TPA: sialidase family protein [Gemmatimonadales bacterium]|nr:sialidase family protein [Gemmatimonadales bacterium]